MSRDFLTDKPLYDITRFTTLDFPENLASIFWFCKCNMRCPYCYNTPIVFGEGTISIQEALNFLKTRQNRLTGIVLSGGECTLYPHLEELCKKIKDLGFKIKIDTNGTNPKLLKHLVQNRLVDYIALDYKAPKEKFENITQNRNFDDFQETLDFLIHTDFPFETRTTVHSGLLNENDINRIIDDLHTRNYTKTYYLQNYLHVDDNIGLIDEQHRQIDILKLNNKIKIDFREF
ncbi:MAG: anaerobic ribonucleoside-triphosphate reductase activating protein [Sulfurospirillum sp.]